MSEENETPIEDQVPVEDVEVTEAPGGELEDATTQADELKARLQMVTEALAAQQQINSKLQEQLSGGNPQEKRVPVRLTGSSNVTFFVRDQYGRKRRYHLSQDNKVDMLTVGQVSELRSSHSSLFDDGLISCAEVVEDGPNTIRDMDAFITGFESVEEVHETLDQIDSRATLWSVYNELEARSVEIVDTDDGKVGKSVRLPPVQSALHDAVKDRLSELADVDFDVQ